MTKTILLNAEGLLHSLSGPAYISEDGNRKEWWVNGVRHRDENEGPAVIDDNLGYYSYYINGKRMRTVDLPALQFGDVKEFWGENGFIRRE